MLTMTKKPSRSLRQECAIRETAMRERRHAIREAHRNEPKGGPAAHWSEFHFMLGAEWTYAAAAMEAGFGASYDAKPLSWYVAVGTRWFSEQFSGQDLEDAERGRDFALSVIRGLESK